jgi:LPS-assembly protein
VTGEDITIDFRHNTFVSKKAEADLKPTFFPDGEVLDDVYVNGVAAHGSGAEVFADYSYITTCNLPDPHFKIYAKHIDLRPSKRIIMRGVTLYILDKKIVSIPYLSIPLDSRRNQLTPEVGDDSTAGYYAKLYIPIPVHGNNLALTARVDEYSKLGTGLGLDFAYQNKTMQGTGEVYTIFGKSSEQDLTLTHDEHFGKTDLNLNIGYSKNDYLQSPGSTLLNFRGQLTVPQKNGSFDQLAFSQSSNLYSGFHSLQESATLTDSRIWNTLLRSNLSIAYSKSSTSGGSYDSTSYSTQTLDVNADVNDDLKKATAELQYVRNVPIGANGMQLFGLQNLTPQITLRSDSTKLLGSKLAQEFPFTTDLALSQLAAPSFDGTSVSNLYRSVFDFNYTKPDHPDRKFDYTVNTQFQQGIYSDSTAQYVTGLNTGTRYTLGPDTAFDMNYSYLEQHGYTPVAQDKQGQTNLLTSDISYRPVRSLILAAQSGYDFLSYQQGITPYQDVGLRAEWHPVDYFQLRTLSTYDTTMKGISNVQVDMAYKPGSTFISAGFRYDGTQHTFGEWDLFLDGVKWGRLKASALLDFDGYTHSFTSEQLSLTYDLHCAEAILQIQDNPSGFRSGTQIAFYIRLKAFPFNTPFGIGTRGQAVGGGFGRSTF